jgi:hypothetical protein
MNVMARDLKQAVLKAAQRVGFDANGKDGIEGYLMWAARKEPKAFITLLGRVLPHTIHATLDMKPLLTRDEAIAELKARGLPTSLIDQLDFIKISDINDPYPDPETIELTAEHSLVE